MARFGNGSRPGGFQGYQSQATCGNETEQYGRARTIRHLDHCVDALTELPARCRVSYYLILDLFQSISITVLEIFRIFAHL